MKKNLFRGALSVFLFGSCLFNTSFPCFAEKPYSAGTIYNGSNTQIGSISGDGSIYNNTTGQQVGQISGNGSVYDSSHRQIAHVGSDGSIYNDTTSQQVGQVTANGSVYDSNNRQIGSVSGNGSVYNQAGQQIGQVPPGNPAVAYGMLQGQRGSAGFGYTSVEQWEAEIRQMQAPQPVPQGQPSCFSGCRQPPAQTSWVEAGIRTLDGFLAGWVDSEQRIYVKANSLPMLHLAPSISAKYSALDTAFYLDTGNSHVPVFALQRNRQTYWKWVPPEATDFRNTIFHHLSAQELKKIQKKDPEKAKNIHAAHDKIAVAQIDYNGQITDMHGKKIAYLELGENLTSEFSGRKEALRQDGQRFSYQDSIGIMEVQGDVRDIHNRFVTRVECYDGGHCDRQNAFLRTLKYEKRHPWVSSEKKAVPMSKSHSDKGYALNYPEYLPEDPTAGIRTLDGFLAGWLKSGGDISLKSESLPELHLDPSVGLKYSGVDTMLSLSENHDRILRSILPEELAKIEQKDPQKAKGIMVANGFLTMGKVDPSGQIRDMHGKKIAYLESGETIFDEYSALAEGVNQSGNSIFYPNVAGILEWNGKVKDIYNRLVGRLNLKNRQGERIESFLCYDMIQQYEKKNPWHKP